MKYVSLAAIRRHWVLIVAMGVLGALGAYLLSLTVTPLYKATTSLYFTLNFGDTASDLAQGSTYTANQMQSFGALATAPVVLEPVIERLDLDTTPAELARAVNVSTPRDTVIMLISVTSTDPSSAAEIANTIASQAGTVIEQYAPQMANGKSSVQVRTIAEAVPPNFQIVPDKKLNTAAGLALGGLLGVATAFALAALDNRVRNAQSLAQITSAPYLGTLRLRPDNVGREAVVLQDPSSQSAEEYRQLRSSLRFSTMSRHPLTLVISSPTPGDGKTTVATNLAGALAEGGQRVLLIDADLRKPRVADYTHAINAVGLCEVLVDEAPLTDATQSLGGSGIDVLTAGDTPPNPGELVSSTKMADLLHQARGAYDVVIVDTAPILAVADATSLVQSADGVLLVARAAVTHKRDLASSVDTIEAAGGTVFGIVINAGKLERSLKDYQYTSHDSEPESSRAWTTVAAGDGSVRQQRSAGDPVKQNSD